LFFNFSGNGIQECPLSFSHYNKSKMNEYMGWKEMGRLEDCGRRRVMGASREA
jgi:hypothetical protein